MEIVKFLTPAEEVIRDLTTRLHKMAMEANVDIQREEERSRQWCNDRWRRMNDETAAMRTQRDALLRAWSDAQPMQPVIVPATT